MRLSSLSQSSRETAANTVLVAPGGPSFTELPPLAKLRERTLPTHLAMKVGPCVAALNLHVEATPMRYMLVKTGPVLDLLRVILEPL